MAMTPGNVVVANNGAVTKSGFAGERFDAMVARVTAASLAWGQPFPPADPVARKQILQTFADMANDLAAVLLHVQAHARTKDDDEEIL